MAKEKKHVLVVDDQPGIRRLLEEVLQDAGYEATVAANGYEGLAAAKKDRPDLILMDMKMPGLDGIAVLKELEPIGLVGRVIMMTAYGELELVTRAKELGAYAYITKPFDIIVLTEMVDSYLSGQENPAMIG